MVSKRAVSEVLGDNLDINVNAWDSGVGNKTKNAGEIFDIYRFSFAPFIPAQSGCHHCLQ